MLNIETEMLEDHQARLVVTVEPDRLQKEMDNAARRIAKNLNIPGFRKGKAPNHIIRRYVGEDALFEEALEPLGQALYKEALEQASIEPFAAGALTDLRREPLTLTFTVPLQPEVDLGNYQDIRVPYEAAEISESDVEAALRNLREEQATLEPVARAVAMGDVAVLDIVGTIQQQDEPDESHPLIERNGVRVLISEDSTYPVPGFPEHIVGIEANQSKEFDVTMADDPDYDEDVRGKTLHFNVICKEVYNRTVPDLNDEFAQSAGDYESLEDLRIRLRTQLEEVATQRANETYTDKIFEQLEPNVRVKYPPIMLQERIDELVEDFDRRLRAQNLNVEEYLRLNGLTMDQLREDFREAAERSLIRALIISQIIKDEMITATDEEIEDEIKTMMLSFGAQAVMASQFFRSPETRRAIASRLLADKASHRLIEIARGGAAPTTDEEAGEKSKKPSRRKKTEVDEAQQVDEPAVKPKRARGTKQTAGEAAPASEDAAESHSERSEGEGPFLS